jgi:hypothetical protein
VKELVRIGRPLNVARDEYGRWSVSPHGWVTEDEWEKIERFQGQMPALPVNFPQEFMDSLMRDTKGWNAVPWAAEVDKRIRSNPSKGVLWNVELTATAGDEGGTEVVILGQESLVVQGRADKYLLRPLARAFCAVANFVVKPLKKE